MWGMKDTTVTDLRTRLELEAGQRNAEQNCALTCGFVASDGLSHPHGLVGA
jgi:hypothetical protein